MPPPDLLQFHEVGDAAVSVVLGDRLDRDIDARLAAAADRLRREPPPGFLDAVPALSSMLVTFEPLEISVDDVVAAVRHHVAAATPGAGAGRRVVIPACYDADLGPDLAAVASATGLTPEEVVELHTGRDLHVHMVGFLPGFAYIGGLAPALCVPRRSTPRVRVPAGAVALAAELTAVYPVDSPGGWNVIGATAVQLFEPSRTPPSLLAAGDTVRFESIDRGELERLRRDAAERPGTGR